MHPDPATEEKELLIRLREGDEHAFNKIYHLYKRRLAGNLRRWLKSSDLVEEALQDLFMKLWDSRANIDPEQPIRAYLFKVAENLVIDLLRKDASEKRIKQHLSVASTELYSHIEENLINKENWELIEKAIDQLPPQRKKVFILCKVEGKTYKEAGSLLGISTAAINDHITKANSFLRDYLGNGTSYVLLMVYVILEKSDLF